MNQGFVMGVTVFIEFVRPRKLAAVRRRVAIGGVAAAWRVKHLPGGVSFC